MNGEMGNPLVNRAVVRTIIALSVAGLMAAQAMAESWQVGESTYSGVRVQKVTPATVTIFHTGGIQQLELESLSVELQERFDYDLEEAARWKEEARKDRQAEADDRASEIRQKLAIRTREPALKAGQGIDPATVVMRREVDLRPSYRELGLFSKDQGVRPSCSVFAVVSALEYENAIQDGTATRFSEEFLIWAMRKMHPGIPLDDGFHFPEVISALQTYGVPPYSIMPNTVVKDVTFRINIDSIEPSEEAILAAETHRSVTPVWLRHDDPKMLERIVGALNHDKPVIIGLRWPNQRAFLHTNLLNKQTPMEDAGHAVTLVGYRNEFGSVDDIRFIFRNSYGQDWGLGGFGFVTGRYLRENLLTALYLNMN